MAEVIQDPKLRKFVHSSVSNTFDLTIDEVAEQCRNRGRFSAWLNGDLGRVKEVLNIVKDNGVSPAYFASYEITEGYNSSWGWLNHTTINGTPTQDAHSVSQWVVSQSNDMSGTPAWIDYANYKDFVPESVKQAGNADFASMSKGSIGRVTIAGTAAATWEVYYPNGLLKEYNGVQDYGAPLSKMIALIEQWGGTISEEGSPDPEEPEEPEEPEDPTDPEEPPSGIDLNKFIRGLTDLIHNLLTMDVYQSGQKNYYQNSSLTLIKQMETMYKIKPNKPFFKKIEDYFDDFNHEYIPEPSPDPEPDPEPDPDPDPDPEPANKVFPVRIQNGVNFFKRSNWGIGTLQRNMTYGPRSTGGHHYGYDIGGGNNEAKPIYAVRGGTVRKSEFRNGIGNAITIEHANDSYFTEYGHLASRHVSVGDTVQTGQQIGTMGATGGNYAVHLDIKIATNVNGFYSYDTTIDPESYLQIQHDNSTQLEQP